MEDWRSTYEIEHARQNNHNIEMKFDIILDLHNVIAFTQLGALDKKRINTVNFSLPSRHLIWYAENKYIMQNYPMKVMFIVIICFFLVYFRKACGRRGGAQI